MSVNLNKYPLNNNDVANDIIATVSQNSSIRLLDVEVCVSKEANPSQYAKLNSVRDSDLQTIAEAVMSVAVQREIAARQARCADASPVGIQFPSGDREAYIFRQSLILW